ncbi:MBOAT family O-acyltransferase [Ferruginibacter sp. SUN002]|uniref:MBOAT family O-acyltransferase n=1 Tax=Ferruginibacter sp. SUN002 TaxID=2937789 RepID=UPI003D36CE8F
MAKTFLGNDGGVGQFLINIPLPIGISFFTFEGISLVVDVFKEKYFEKKDALSKSIVTHGQRTLLFISFFPHLIAGPILKAHDFLPQITEKKIKAIQWETAFRNILLGYFLKLVVADNLKDFTYWMDFPYFQSRSSVTLIFLLIAYSCQIFADFAGYSLIAIGLAKLFGYNFNPNFSFPYISTSFSEFWRRWHISLSSFLKEYLYIPMGGNRKGKIRTYLHLMITMILGGLWHGAAWSYAIWGAFHGIFLAIERLLVDYFGTINNRLFKVFKGFFVFACVTLIWLLFKLPNFSNVLGYLYCIKSNWYRGIDMDMIQFILLYSLPVFLYHFYYLLKPGYSHVLKKYDHLVYGFLLFLIIFNSGSPGDFIYFQF